MFEITKEFHFDAAHFLPGYDGPCGQMHGHRWVVTVALQSPLLWEGMVMDFTKIKDNFGGYLDHHCDHKVLNDEFPDMSPTAENLARHFYEVASDRLPNVAWVSVAESPTSVAKYWEA